MAIWLCRMARYNRVRLEQAGGHQTTHSPTPEREADGMRRAILMVAVLVAALSHAGISAAQELPAGGYYADGAYYVPNASSPPSVAQAAPNTSPGCPVGY